MELKEDERKCRLDTDTANLNIFNVYTRAACMLECQMKYAKNRCGCIPWDYPFNIKEKVQC